MLRSAEFPLHNSLKVVDHILTVDEVLKSEVDEDLVLTDLDKAGVVRYLCPPLCRLLPERTSMPQIPQKSEIPARKDLPNSEDIV